MEKLAIFIVLAFKACLCLEQKIDRTSIAQTRFGDGSFEARRRLFGIKPRGSVREPKIIDIYTNHPKEKEVEDNFYTLHPGFGRKGKNRTSYSDVIVDRKDTLDFPDIENFFSFSKKYVLESDYGDFEAPNISQNTFITRDDENLNSDETKYLYPERPPFYTKTRLKQPSVNENPEEPENDNNFVFLQSQVVIPDSENYGSFYLPTNVDSGLDSDRANRPNFWTKQPNFQKDDDSDTAVKPYSYVQKIPSPKRRATTTTDSSEVIDINPNKYEEVDLSFNHVQSEEKPKDRKNQINDMMRKFVAKLLIEKYGLRKGSHRENKNRTNDGGSLKINKMVLSPQNITIPEIDSKSDQESKLLYSNALWDLKNKTIAKIRQFFSLFTVIKFNNTECNATNWAGTWQGVCLTSIECTQSNGTALGNCANGYGVCCIFRGSCGDSSSMNCSYFKSPNYPDYYPSDGGVITPTTTATPTPAPTPDPRFYWYYYKKGWGDGTLDNLITRRQSTSDTMSCEFSVYKINSNIQQFRIDFIDLDLAGPTDGTCTDERLVITGQNANDQLPVLCGYNTGQHVYVDVSELTGPLQIMVLSTTGARKRFKLKICQYTDSCSTSQSNCLQYYTGASGVIQSFNYDQAAMFNRSSPGYFNDLNYAICIRRESGYCSIAYSNVRGSQMYPFQLTNVLPNGLTTVPADQAGVDVLNCPDDYVIIDGTRLCGDRFNDGSTETDFTMNAVVTDSSTGPIVINVRSNGNITGLGFKLYYTQNPCTSN